MEDVVFDYGQSVVDYATLIDVSRALELEDTRELETRRPITGTCRFTLESLHRP